MSRPTLAVENISQEALAAISSFHSDVVKEVQESITKNKVVVVGMSQNPFVKKARVALGSAGVDFKYLQYGSYFSGWKQRLAIKLWSGWPTYPQVFVDGKLVGGFKETEKFIESGKLKPGI